MFHHTGEYKIDQETRQYRIIAQEETWNKLRGFLERLSEQIVQL